MEMREAMQEKEDQKTMKAKMREKVKHCHNCFKCFYIFSFSCAIAQLSMYAFAGMTFCDIVL